MKNITIHLKFFGAFRQYGSTCDVTVPEGSTIENVKSLFAEKMTDIDIALIQSSALANDHSILTSSDILNDDCTMSILPPVCGG